MYFAYYMKADVFILNKTSDSSMHLKTFTVLFDYLIECRTYHSRFAFNDVASFYIFLPFHSFFWL